MEQLNFNLLFRWFVGLGVDDRGLGRLDVLEEPDRLLAGEVAQGFLAAVLGPPVKRLLSPSTSRSTAR